MVHPNSPFYNKKLKAMFKSAINEGYHTENLYLKIAGQGQDQELKQLCHQMAEYKKHHRLRLEKRLSYS